VADTDNGRWHCGMQESLGEHFAVPTERCESASGDRVPDRNSQGRAQSGL